MTIRHDQVVVVRSCKKNVTNGSDKLEILVEYEIEGQGGQMSFNLRIGTVDVGQI